MDKKSSFKDRQLAFTSEVPSFLKQFKHHTSSGRQERDEDAKKAKLEEYVDNDDKKDFKERDDEKPQIVHLEAVGGLDNTEVESLLERNPDLVIEESSLPAKKLSKNPLKRSMQQAVETNSAKKLAKKEHGSEDSKEEGHSKSEKDKPTASIGPSGQKKDTNKANKQAAIKNKKLLSFDDDL